MRQENFPVRPGANAKTGGVYTHSGLVPRLRNNHGYPPPPLPPGGSYPPPTPQIAPDTTTISTWRLRWGRRVRALAILLVLLLIQALYVCIHAECPDCEECPGWASSEQIEHVLVNIKAARPWWVEVPGTPFVELVSKWMLNPQDQ